jgi:hypothetical protein
VQQAEDEYLAHRWNVDVKRGSITEGRWATIKSHLNHFVAYCAIVGREAQSSVTRLNDLESKSLQGYQHYRQQKGAKDVTIKNEQSTINALCKWAFEEGLHNIPHYIFPSISRRGVDADSLRLSTDSDDEYGRITRVLVSYTSKKAAHKLQDESQVRIQSRVGDVVTQVMASDEVMPGVVSLPHGWGHKRAGVNMTIAAERDRARAVAIT